MPTALIHILVFSALAAISTVSCATIPVIPTRSQVSYYDQRVDPIFNRVMSALPRGMPKLGYVVWHNTSPISQTPFAIDTGGRVVYISDGLLKDLSDDALAFGIAHEAGHMVIHSLPAPLVAIGSIGGSAGIGTAVGCVSTWWIGTFSGGLVFLVVLPPIILAASRDNETEADEFGLRAIHQAGFSARKATVEWCEMMTRLFNKSDPTHPETTRRCAAMTKVANQLEP